MNVAIAGIACRYPDADDPGQLHDLVLTRRRAFRRIPDERLGLGEYFDPSRDAPDKTYSDRAALLEGWSFDREAFRIPGSIFRAADPAHWLALETAGRALADAGHPEGAGLDRDRVAVIMGNTLTGETTRAATMRLRWPYVQRVLRETTRLGEEDLQRVRERFLSPFEPVGDETLAGGLSNTIAGRICNHFDFHGGCYTVDGACASSLLAVLNACAMLRNGEADLVLAGGVDLSLDPFELIGFAKAGALAAERMRVYDERSEGFWPGEGCGVVALTRAADAREPYAEIIGTGLSSDGRGGITRPEPEGQLLALRRAYAGVDPGKAGLIEGHGTGTAVGDAAELTALTRLRGDAEPAALGSIKANIGHTKAAAGLAGLIKAAMSIASATLPPTTGCERPHPLLGSAPLRILDRPEPWDGPRVAGVSAMGFGGVNTHVVLGETTVHRPVTVMPVSRPAPDVEVFAFSGEVRPVLERLAVTADRLSESELHDLACHLAERPAEGEVRLALTASTPEQLGRRCDLALRMLDGHPRGRLATSRGVYLGVGLAGRVTLLFPGQGAPVRDAPPDAISDTAVAQPAILRSALDALRSLESLGVRAQAAIGHSLGEIAGLVWAGCLDEADAVRLTRERGRLMSRLGRTDTGMISLEADPEQLERLGAGLTVAAHNGPRSFVLAGSADDIQAAVRRAADDGVVARVLPVTRGFHSAAVADCAAPFKAFLEGMAFRAPQSRLISTVTARALTECDAPAELLCTQITEPVLFWDALREIAGETDLFCETGPGHTLSALVAASLDVPVVATDDAASVPAALFAAGALSDLRPLATGRSHRPIDIWRDRTFLTNPCSVPAAPASEPRAPAARVPETPQEPVPTPDLVVRMIADAVELDPSAIEPGHRLLADLNLTSLTVGRLAMSAAKEAGRMPPRAAAPLAEATVGELISEIEALPTSGGPDEMGIPGVGPWIRCFTEDLVPAGPPEGTDPGLVIHVPDITDHEADRLIEAARSAVPAGTLTVVTHQPGLSGFLRSLHEEYSDLTITLLRTPPGGPDQVAAWTAPGRFREIVLDADGNAFEPRPRLVPLPEGGALPINGADVVLVSGGGKGIGYECAAALARAASCTLALLGRADPADDEVLAANLDRLREEGIAVGYEPADVVDEEQVAAAVQNLQERHGKITVIVHAAGINRPRRFAELSTADVREHLAPKLTGLRNLMRATHSGPGPRLVVTFGSVIGRYGLAGECHYALANGALRAEAERLGALHLDWSVWAGAGMGERLGVLDSLLRRDVAAIPVAEGTALFLRLLGTASASVTIHGRTGAPPSEVRRAGRFVEHVLVHYPGVEIVAEATIDLERDAYLDGHRIDGTVVLPGAAMIEAMAQAASVLGGGPVLSQVTLDRPITIEGSRRIRVCALRRADGAIEAVVRSDETGMHADHARAVFPVGELDDRVSLEIPSDGIAVDSLYESVCFHTGRFRRIRELRAASRHVRATLHDAPADLIVDLDATIHALQACVPHRRLLPVGCSRLMIMRDGRVHRLEGAERHASGGEYVWDVVALDAADRPVITWEGLRLKDAGPIAPGALEPPLLSIHLERMALSLGLDQGLRVSIGRGARSMPAARPPYGVSRSHLSDGPTLTVRADAAVACDWERVSPVAGAALGPAFVRLRDRLAERCPEPADASATRLWTVAECLSKMGLTPDVPLVIAGVYDGGWTLLRCGDGLIASVVTSVAGPVAVSIMTSPSA